MEYRAEQVAEGRCQVKVAKLTDEQIRLEIAGLLGWNRPKNVVNEFWDKANPLMFCSPTALMYYGNAKTIPDWTSDLNAMGEAEKAMTEKQKTVYLTLLSEKVVRDGANHGWCWGFATARQRAEAFVEVMKRPKHE